MEHSRQVTLGIIGFVGEENNPLQGLPFSHFGYALLLWNVCFLFCFVRNGNAEFFLLFKVEKLEIQTDFVRFK
jgi:hypothetical protein